MASIFESAVNMVRDDKRTYWYSNYPPEVRKMERFLKDYPDDVKIEKDYRNETGEAYGLTVSVPMKWYKTPSAPKKRNLTDEQRAAISQRMRNSRSNKNKE